MSIRHTLAPAALLLGVALGTPGCVHTPMAGDPVVEAGCDVCSADQPCGECSSCDPHGGGLRGRLSHMNFVMFGWLHKKSNAIPETLPLGSAVRAHYQVMETNGEAADFIFHRHDFVADTAELTPDGKDKVLEIAARMRSTPFPVLIERGENNSDPELDAIRRTLIARILTDMGNPDANQRTIVATPYGPGYNAIQAEPMYYRHILTGGVGNNFGQFGNTPGQYGGFGGGGGGGVGFGP
ncbi:hypothetical protein Mal4_24120 [Maioricimonas rarisocia]|uniref:Uncharacterized protein n=1 Tax=Maioricimonas rarisocia TaxID=2528026 RepID=A0A517Z6P7_9PLAN|nr:hypothetical protein [Maioricimonas rarisocia]QDU38091.1 hypothetical protein Mal4_24120 [Maioricimonas rarisocia]